MVSLPLRMWRHGMRRASLVSLKRPRSHGHCLSSRHPCAFERRWFSSQESPPASGPNPSNTESKILQPIYDTSSNWEDWFSPEEYGDPWAFPDREGIHPPSPNPTTQTASSTRTQKWILEPLDEDKSLDSQSRYLMRQLQLIYQDGYSDDDVTQERCLFMIGQLLASAQQISQEPQYRGVADNGATLIRQRVLRAEAILRTMELFWDYIPDLLEEDTVVNATYQYTPRNRRIVTQWNGHKPIVKWPVPTYEAYVLVLRGIATLLRFPKQYQKLHNEDTPWICQDVVLRLFRFHKTKGLVYLDNPPVEAFNQVLATWANAHGDRDHPHKALHATQFFMDMKLIYNVVPDQSSYSHVLRACAHPDENEVAMELGPKVALRFWKGELRGALQANAFTPTPFLFVFALRALSGLWKVADEDEKVPLKEMWDEACRYGMVNEHVLYELEQSSRWLFRELLKEYRGKVDTYWLQASLHEAYDKSYHREMMKYLPREWMTNITSETSSSRQEMINDPNFQRWTDSGSDDQRQEPALGTTTSNPTLS